MKRINAASSDKTTKMVAQRQRTKNSVWSPALHEFMANRRRKMRLASAGQAEEQEVLGVIDKVTLAQIRQEALDAQRA
jgi:hypothetical protein